jgi:hypothetical protein
MIMLIKPYSPNKRVVCRVCRGLIVEKRGLKMANNQLPLDLKAPNTDFFCQACLEDRPLTEQSQDARYCNSCYEFLKAEAAQLPPGRHPAWLPKGVTTPQAPSTALPVVRQNPQPQKHTPAVERGVLSTSNAKGRPHLDLPEDKIRELAATGLGPKGIAAILCDWGIMVSSRTVKRMLLTFASVGKTEGD